MKRNIVKAFALAVVLLLAAPPSPAANFTLVMAACPPWKHGEDEEATRRMLAMCANGGQAISSALNDAFGVPAPNRFSLVQERATSENLRAVLKRLEAKLGEGDTLFFFQISHGGVIPHFYKGYPVVGEVFAYYTEKKPADFSRAVSDGRWTAARTLRDMIGDLAHTTGADVVTIIESCDADSAGHSFQHNPLLALSDKPKLAVIFSSQADQLATFNDASDNARFTEELVNALEGGKKGSSLYDAFEKAVRATHRGALAFCRKQSDGDLQDLYGDADQYYENCMQLPTFFDPKGLLDEIKIGS